MPLLLGIGIVLLLAGHAATGGDKKYPDGYFRDRANENEMLVVFVAGLAGEASWTHFTKLIDSDADLDKVDYLVFHSPQSFDIEENVRRAETILRDIPGPYDNTVFVGHSIGGIIIKRWLLRQAGEPPEKRELPDMLITFGTPLDTDKFSISLFQRLGARVFWAAVPELKREVFNIDRLREINKSWRTAVKQAPLNEIKLVNVFGVEDETAPVDNEHRSQGTVFITGDHLGIISPGTAGECSWKIFRAMLVDGNTPPETITCVLP